jgi:signal transduction histidine kinase
VTARTPIRNRLVTIVLLGTITSALSLVALMRAVSMTEALRTERARDAIISELERLARLPPSPEALAATPATSFIGLRGGWLRGPGDVAGVTALPATWRAPLERATAGAAGRHERVLSETAFGPAKLVLAVEPAGAAGLAWTGYLIPPSAYLRPWRWITYGLAIATALLVATALWGAFSFRRSAAALHATLVALGKDLTTPVPRPRLADLTGIADGIRGMAAELLASREATERLLRELAQKERLAALGRVAAGVAHEVRNPLASIKLRLDLTAATHQLPPAAQGAVEAASQEIARLDRLVGDLLLVAGKKMGPRSSVDLGALVRARAEALGPWAAVQRVELRVVGEGTAVADAESIARAIDNVLRNAVDASPAGGTVTARVAEASESVEVHVDDAGRGVEPARVSELFEPFFTTKSEGTGLGLAISRAIARAHGGDLTYARLDEITRFALSLPRGEAARASGAIAAQGMAS